MTSTPNPKPSPKPKPKCVFVIGPTGSGKSQLAIDVARATNGEIVNADAMQCYRGLDIATNKASAAEMRGVAHHLLSIVDPLPAPQNPPFDIRAFTTVALATMEAIAARGRLPIVCGGTNYYVQALLMTDSLVTDDNDRTPEVQHQEEEVQEEDRLHQELSRRTTESLYGQLAQLDPQICQKLHAHDRRKILRALHYCLATGKPYSGALQEQLARGSGTFAPQNVRFDALVLCTAVPRAPLMARLDARVDEMVARGLLAEIRAFYEELGAPDLDSFPHSTGLLQAIGLKEFLPSLRCQNPSTLPAVEKECIEALKIRTRRYAKKQEAWIEHQFVARGMPVWTLSPDRAGAAAAVALVRQLMGFDGCYYDALWEEIQNGKDGAQLSVKFAVDGATLRRPQNPKGNSSVAATTGGVEVVSRAQSMLEWQKQTCDVCGVTVNGANEWRQHLASKLHRKNSAPQKEYPPQYYEHAKKKRKLESSTSTETST